MSAVANSAHAAEAVTTPTSASIDAPVASDVAATAASNVTAASASAASAASAAADPAPPKQWKIADVPEGADPLDYINMEKLKEDNKSLPTTKEGISKFLNEMPITADIMPG
jgi:hypothetical protein